MSSALSSRNNSTKLPSTNPAEGASDRSDLNERQLDPTRQSVSLVQGDGGTHSSCFMPPTPGMHLRILRSRSERILDDAVSSSTMTPSDPAEVEKINLGDAMPAFSPYC